MRATTAALAGALFALGLMISDMTSPGRIVGFLDLGGSWDPTLMFVMAGAIGVYAPFAWRARRRRHPWFAHRFHWPTQQRVDVALVGGAALFGVGWGLSGFCPGPALLATGTGRTDTLVFVAALLAGTVAVRLWRAATTAT